MFECTVYRPPGRNLVGDMTLVELIHPLFYVKYDCRSVSCLLLSDNNINVQQDYAVLCPGIFIADQNGEQSLVALFNNSTLVWLCRYGCLCPGT